MFSEKIIRFKALEDDGSQALFIETQEIGWIKFEFEKKKEFEVMKRGLKIMQQMHF